MVLSLDNHEDIDYEKLFNNLSEEELFSIMQLCQTALHGILGWE
jgi:hypothetical protein